MSSTKKVKKKDGITPNRRGRPSDSDKVLMLKDLKPYYESNKSALYTAQNTKYSIRTINKIFKKWSETLIAEDREDFIESQKLSKARGIIALETAIGDLEKLLIDIRKQTPDSPDGALRRSALIKNTIKDIATMQQAKTYIEMKPTVDVSLEEQISKIIQDKKVREELES